MKAGKVTEYKSAPGCILKMTAKKDETTDVSSEAIEKEKATDSVKTTAETAVEEKVSTDTDSTDQEATSESKEEAPTDITEEVVEENANASAEESTDVEKNKDDAPKKSSQKTTAKENKEKDAAPDSNGKPVDLKNFDWGAVDSNIDDYSPEERKKLESVYEATLSSISDQEVLDGTIVSISKREVVINIGYKSEGVISISEFRYNPDLKVGDVVQVYVDIQEDRLGQLILSHKKARILQAWEQVNAALGTDEVIQGYVKCRTKGGLIVDVLGLEAFLPGSQIDVKPVRDYDMYVGKQMEFRVVKINKEFKNVVVSHKALIESELKEQRKEIISKLEKGQVLEGIVKNITSYGVFMDLGGVDGLVHITDLSWSRISHPEEIVKLDEKLNVVILDFDEGKTRIQLGLKQLTEHPWESLGKKLEPGIKVDGKVVVVADYGAFVEVAPGVEGLIHVSEMSWSQHLRSAQDFLKVGDKVKVEILTMDKEDRKMSLGMKQLVDDPWKGVDKKYQVGSKHKGIIRNFTNYGIFVELEEGVDGLIHKSDLSWSKKINHPAEFANLGDEVEIIILELDMDERKVSLGHKQLEENPWEAFETVFTIDSVHKGTVISIHDKGTIVTLPHGVEAFTPGRHAIKEDGSKLQMEDTVEFKVLEFSKESKRILVSHTATYKSDVGEPKRPKKSKARSIRKSVSEVRQNLEKTTLGDIDALSALKSDLEAVEKGKTPDEPDGNDE